MSDSKMLQSINGHPFLTMASVVPLGLLVDCNNHL